MKLQTLGKYLSHEAGKAEAIQFVVTDTLSGRDHEALFGGSKEKTVRFNNEDLILPAWTVVIPELDEKVEIMLDKERFLAHPTTAVTKITKP